MPAWAARAALAVAILRYAIPVLALGAAPTLIPDDVGLLVLLRPSKEVLLLAGGLSATSATAATSANPGLLVAIGAYVPLMIFGVWAFYVVGRAYGARLDAGEGPRWLQRAVPADRFVLARELLERRGATMALIARLAALPPTVMAAAAGAAEVPVARYLLADLVGALAAFGIVFGAGYALGDAYESGGPWLTAGALLVLVIGGVLVARWVRRELRGDPEHNPSDAR